MKTKQEQDHRTVLSLLPGRLAARKLIEDEIKLVRSSIQEGKRYWLALLPGLELELDHIKQGLEPSGPQEAEEQEQPKQLKASSTCTIAEAIGLRPAREGKPCMHVIILAELITRGQLKWKEFAERWKGEYPNAPYGHANPVATLTRTMATRGLQIKPIKGGAVLLSAPIGEWPEAVREHPYLIKALSGTTPALPSPSSPPLPPPPTNPPKQPEINPKDLTRAQILAMEFANAPEHTLDFNGLEKKYKTGKLAFHFTAKQLRQKKGYKFKRVGNGLFKMTKKGNQ